MGWSTQIQSFSADAVRRKAGEEDSTLEDSEYRDIYKSRAPVRATRGTGMAATRIIEKQKTLKHSLLTRSQSLAKPAKYLLPSLPFSFLHT
jgi:hypothetical protein